MSAAEASTEVLLRKTQARLGFMNGVIMMIVVSLFTTRIAGEYVGDPDPNLDKLSLDIFANANFPVTKDNYVVSKNSITLDISTLPANVLANELVVEVLNMIDEEYQYKYSNSKQFVFSNGANQSLRLKGIVAIGMVPRRTDFINFDNKQQALTVLGITGVKNVIIEEFQFKNINWCQTRFFSIDGCSTVSINGMTSENSMGSIVSFLNITNTIESVVIKNFDHENLLKAEQIQVTNVPYVLFDSIKMFNVNQTSGWGDQGYLQLINVDNVELKNIQVKGNQQKNVLPYFQIQGKSSSQKVSVSNALFTDNYLMPGTPVIGIQSYLNVSVSNITITNNTQLPTTYLNDFPLQYGSIISIDSFYSSDSQVSFVNGTFANNTSLGYGGSLQLSAGSMNLTNCTFYNNTSLYGGGAVYFMSGLNVSVSNCSFSQNFASGSGGALSSNSIQLINFQVNATSFIMNSAQSGNGGAISIQQASFLNIISSSLLLNTASSGQGGGVYCQNCKFFGSQTSSIAMNNADQGGGYFISSMKFMSIWDSSFIQNQATEQGGAIYAKNCQLQFAANNLHFSHNSASDGGALFFEQKTSISFYSVILDSNLATGCGGAIASQSSIYIYFTDSIISKNSAGFGGGAISVNTFQYLIASNLTVSGNRAFVGGGLYTAQMLFQTDYETQDYKQYFTGNIAQLYGNDVGVVPNKIELKAVYEFNQDSQTYSELKFQKLQNQINVFSIQNVKSSSQIAFMWELSNQSETVLLPIVPINKMNNDLRQIISVNQQLSTVTELDSYLEQKYILNSAELIPSDSMFSSSFYVIGRINSEITSYIYLGFGTNVSPVEVTFDFHFRNCIVGEILVKDIFPFCLQCAQGTYSFEDPTQNPNLSCITKPNQVLESYGNVWVMDSGYWRNSVYDTSIIQCQVPQACIGGEGFGDSLCDVGYNGVGCLSCVFNEEMQYTNNLSTNQCTNCADKSTTNIYLIGVILAFIISLSCVVIVSLIRNTIKSKLLAVLISMRAFREDKYQTQLRLFVVYVKMLLHFCQVSLALSFFQISQLSISSTLFVIPRFIGDSLLELVALSSCFFSPTGFLTSTSIAFTELLFVQILPIIFYSVLIGVLFVLSKKSFISKQEFSYLSYNLLWFFFVSLFSLSMLRSMIGIVSCSNQGNYRQMYADASIVCDTSETRKILIISFITPFFAVFCGLGPLKVLQKLLEKNKTSNKQENRIHLASSLVELYEQESPSLDSVDSSQLMESLISSRRTTVQQKKTKNKAVFRIETMNVLNYAYLTAGYRVKYWEMVRFIVREVMLTVVMFFNEDPSIGGSISILVILGYLYAVHKFLPFKSGQLNLLEKEGAIIQAFSLFAFVIICLVKGDEQFEMFSQILCAAIYLVFSWFLIKIFYFILVSAVEGTKAEILLKKAFNYVIPNSFKINHEMSLQKWKFLARNRQRIMGLRTEFFNAKTEQLTKSSLATQ